MPDAGLKDSNEINLRLGLSFLSDLIAARVREHLGQDPGPLPQPQIVSDASSFAELAHRVELKYDDYTVLMLALAPHLQPALIEAALRDALGRDGDFAEFGGLRDAESRALIPTGETAAFLLAGEDLEARFGLMRLFEPDHWFARDHILTLEPARDGAPHLSGRLSLARDWIERLTLGRISAPGFSAEFPARAVEPRLDWDDLVLEEDAATRLSEVRRWLRHRDALSAAALPAGHRRPGYRVLFHGPSGTGKTLAAGLLGKVTGRAVYRVDLSAVVSKYIGETEKNLSLLFETAQSRDWVLFFDEADALFGKRTSVRDAHDRYANQEVSYLLQRIEDYDGLAILASNLQANIDDAFLSRFDTVVRFSMPSEAERARIWAAALPASPCPRDVAGFGAAMARFPISGRAIVGAVQFATLAAIDAGSPVLSLADAAQGVRREMEKEGRVFKNLIARELAEEDAAARG